MPEKKVGKVVHFFDHPSVAVVELTSSLKVGDKISVKGSKTDFSQKVESMQIEHKQISSAKKGDSVGLKVIERVRKNDAVFLG